MEISLILASNAVYKLAYWRGLGNEKEGKRRRMREKKETDESLRLVVEEFYTEALPL